MGNTQDMGNPSEPLAETQNPDIKDSEIENKIKSLQTNDPDLNEIIKWVVNKQKPQWEDISHTSETLKYYWVRFDSLSHSDGVLYHKWEGIVPKYQSVLLKSLAWEVLVNIHCNITGGHLGVNKTLSKVRDKYFWHKMSQDVKNFCNACDKCGARKSPNKAPKALLQKYVVGVPMERWAIDILGPLPLTPKKNMYLMVVGDYFTKWIDAIPVKNKKSVTVAHKFITHIVAIFGVPMQIHSDQGQTFESEVFKEICQILGIDKTRTTPYRPQSDGMIERANRTIENMLATFVS